MVSFSTEVKDEISKEELGSLCCQKAELSAILQMRGSVKLLGKNNIGLEISTENASIARRIFNIIKKLYKVQSEILVKKNRQLKKNNSYILLLEDRKIVEKILIDTELLEGNKNIIYGLNNRLSKKIVKKRCCKRAYIRGAFLGGGSVSNPEKTYHLEFITNDYEYGIDLMNLINTFDLTAKLVERKDNYIVYLKEGEQVSDILNIIGAYQGLLKLEDIRVIKEMRNNINRIVNCETANLNKTIGASLRQIKKIEYIEKNLGIDNLPENLVEIARLRLENRDLSLKELGELLVPPISKSGVNHRLRKLEQIADKINK